MGTYFAIEVYTPSAIGSTIARVVCERPGGEQQPAASARSQADLVLRCAREDGALARGQVDDRKRGPLLREAEVLPGAQERAGLRRVQLGVRQQRARLADLGLALAQFWIAGDQSAHDGILKHERRGRTAVDRAPFASTLTRPRPARVTPLC